MEMLLSMLIESIEEAEDLDEILDKFKDKHERVSQMLDKLINAVSLSDKLENIKNQFKYEEKRQYTLSGLIETEPWWTKEFVDSPRTRHEIKRKRRRRVDIVEMIEWQEPYVREDMIPDRMAFVEMGVEERKTPWLDSTHENRIIHAKYDKNGKLVRGKIVKCPVNTMNDRMFRECVRYGRTLNAMYQKASADLNTGTKPEWLADETKCELIDAFTITESFKRMNIDFKTTQRLVWGYWDERNAEWKNGLQNMGKIKGIRYAKYFENLVHEIDAQIDDTRAHYHDVSQRMIASGDWRLRYHEEMPTVWSQMKFIEDSTLIELDTEIHIYDPIDDEETGFVSYMGDEEFTVRGDDGFGTFPLMDGSEDIDYEFGLKIKGMSLLEIQKLQQKFYPQYNQYTGRRKSAEYWWMTTMQRRQCWPRISERKDELLKEAMASLTDDSMEVLAIVKELEYPKQKRAFIAAYCAGNPFNICGYEYKWKHKPGKEEAYAVWETFKKES